MARSMLDVTIAVSADVRALTELMIDAEALEGLAPPRWVRDAAAPVDPAFVRRCRLAMRQLEFEVDHRRMRKIADAAMIHRALYRIGFPTPYSRQIDDWLALDPPTWEFTL